MERLDVTAPAAVNLFETTIRIVGGLLSAHYLSAESHPTLSQGLGEKAAALGERLLPGFTTSPSGAWRLPAVLGHRLSRLGLLRFTRESAQSAMCERTCRAATGPKLPQGTPPGAHTRHAHRPSEACALGPAAAGIPYSDVNLQTGQASSPAWAKISSLSEVATLSLEFTHLARLTGAHVGTPPYVLCSYLLLQACFRQISSSGWAPLCCWVGG